MDKKDTTNKTSLSPKWKKVIIGGVPGILVGSASAAFAMGAHPTEEAPEEETSDSEVSTGTKTFSEAFTEAREEGGAGAPFVWNGNVYVSYKEDEWDEMTDDQKEEAATVESAAETVEEVPVEEVSVEEVDAVEEVEPAAETVEEAPAEVSEAPETVEAESEAEESEDEVDVMEAVDRRVFTGADGDHTVVSTYSINGHTVQVSDYHDDGLIDTVAVDTDGDQKVDVLCVDSDDDGHLDVNMVDTNGDGSYDIAYADDNHDGHISSSEVYSATADGQIISNAGDDSFDGVQDYASDIDTSIF